jgi:hypothetical protein
MTTTTSLATRKPITPQTATLIRLEAASRLSDRMVQVKALWLTGHTARSEALTIERRTFTQTGFEKVARTWNIAVPKEG